MTRIPKKSSLEVVHILREHIVDYQQTYSLCPEHYKIVYDLLNCRTAYLGGHIQKCDHCGTERITFLLQQKINNSGISAT